MTDKFLKAIPYILEHEGGYNDIKEDKGGATKYGISLRFLKGVGLDINKDNKVDNLDIKALDTQTATEIYFDNFWRSVYDKMPERTAIKVFDMAVNMGSTQAHIILQRAVNNVSHAGISVDGLIGNKTITEIQSLNEPALLISICKEQGDFYKAIVTKNPSQKKFLKGWSFRANWLP